MKRIILLVSILIMCGVLVFSKSNYHLFETKVSTRITDEDTNKIYTYVEDMPSYPGGDSARMNFILKNIKYPTLAKEQGIEGTVYIQFVVEKDGSLTDVKLLREIGGGLGEEAIRVVKLMPKWNPAKHRGVPVRALFYLPIKFTLSGIDVPNTSNYNDEMEEAIDIDSDSEIVITIDDMESKIPEDSLIFTFVQEMPSYPGGEKARINFIAQNIKYPSVAKNKGIEGTVYLQFVVEKDGSLTNFKLLRGIGYGCDEEAIRVLKLMPKWNPGKQRNKFVRCNFNIAITFRLPKNEKTDIKNKEDYIGYDVEADEADEKEEAFVFVEEKPQFPGGDEMFAKYMKENFKYPRAAKKNNIKGTIKVGFVIEKDGSVSNVKIFDGLGGGLDEEVSRVIAAMPKWTPGKTRGRIVRTQKYVVLGFPELILNPK